LPAFSLNTNAAQLKVPVPVVFVAVNTAGATVVQPTVELDASLNMVNVELEEAAALQGFPATLSPRTY